MDTGSDKDKEVFGSPPSLCFGLALNRRPDTKLVPHREKSFYIENPASYKTVWSSVEVQQRLNEAPYELSGSTKTPLPPAAQPYGKQCSDLWTRMMSQCRSEKAVTEQ